MLILSFSLIFLLLSSVDASAGSSPVPATFSPVPKYNQSAEVTSSTTTTTATSLPSSSSPPSTSPSSLNQNGGAISELFISNSSLNNANNRSRRSPFDHNNSLSKNRHYANVRSANACDLGHSCTEGSTCVPTGESGKYSCVCRAGLTGPFCEQDIDECYEQPGICRNGATCVNTIGSYSCICVNGWTGNHCESNIDDCAYAGCFNGATCLDRVGSFFCVCPTGKTGLLCQLDDACMNDPCGLNKGSKCDTSPLDGSFVCTCPAGYKGNDCSEDIDECAMSSPPSSIPTNGNYYNNNNNRSHWSTPRYLSSRSVQSSPCEHDGLCINTIGSFMCHCPAGFTGPRCETDVNECASNPCLNEGTCLDERGFYRCVCMPGYTGTRCQHEVDECANNPCNNGAICTDMVNGFRCICPPGFDGNTCSNNIDDCQKNPCRNGATCKDSLDSYICKCPPGFNGPNCEINIDECANGPCRNGATCIDQVNTFTCKCPIGFTGLLCQNLVNECLSSPCVFGGTCVDLIGQAAEAMKTVGSNATTASTPSSYMTRAQLHLQILDGNSRGFKCICPPGTTGPRCQTNLDDCWSSPCLNNGTCTDLINGFRCTCPPGYTGPTCSLDVDECATGGVCMNGATCINMNPGFKCLCPSGFFGQTCTKDRDDCLSSPCMNGGKCRDHPGHGHYSCLCPAAFTGSRCESRAESNICNGNPCAHGSTCIPFSDVTDVSRYTGNSDSMSNSGFKCACRPGYEGTRCEKNINECEGDPCMNGGTCLDGQNSFNCLCPLPFSGHRCDISLDPCLVNSCSARSRCAQSPDLKNYTCLCDPGFTGPTCSEDINECTALEPPVRSYSYHARRFNKLGLTEVVLCLNGGTCMNTVGSFQCYCPRGFTGTRCETDINECEGDGGEICLNGGTCLDGMASFTCLCAQGYGGTRCEQRVQSCASSPCLQGARCTDAGPVSYGTYKCHCPTGFSGRNCQFNDDDCSPSSCLNGGTCIDGINSFTCQCATGFGGSNCQFRTDGTVSQTVPEATAECRTFSVRRRLTDGTDVRCLESNPWRDCPSAAECFSVFANGICDPQCNKRECVFDGMDCSRPTEPSTCNPLYDEYCLANYANGFCDQGCNNRECGWDGLDCIDNKTHAAAALPGTVTITLDSPFHFLELAARQDFAKIQRYLSSLVQGTVFELKSIQRDNKTGNGQLEMQVNQAVCDRGNDCFSSVIEVEEYLGALQSTQSTFSSPLPGSAMRISSVSAFDPVYRSQNPSGAAGQNYSMTVMMSIGFLLVLSGVILGVLYQTGSIGSPGLGNFKPKLKAKGITWFPEGFERPNKTHHQDITKRSSAAARAAGGDFGRRPRMTYSDGQEMHSLSSSTQLMQREADMLHRQMISCHEQEVTDDISKPGSTTTTTTAYDSIYDEPLEDRRWTHQHLEAYQGRAAPGSNGAILSPHPPIYDTIKRRLGSSSSPPPSSPYGMTPMSPGGPGPDVRGPGGMTPLMVASAFDSQTLFCQQSLSNQFTNYPASPSTLLLENNIMSDKSVASPQPKDVVGELIMNGASIDKQSDTTGETSLHFAARYSRADAAKRLLDHNANANAVDFRNRTPLHAAVSADARGVFEILLHYRQTDINAADDMGYTPLMLAVKNNMQDMVDDLLVAEAQVDIVDKRMKTALHWAACVNNVPAIKALLAAGANKDAQDEFEQTPLFLAAREGAKEAVEVLLAAGANRDITDHCDKLPRDAATSLEHYDIVALLDGANVLIPSSQAGMVYQNVYQAPAQALSMMHRAEAAQENATKGTLKKKSSARRPSCSSSSDPSENDNQQTQQPATGKRATGRSQTLGRNKGANGGNSSHRRSSSAARATGKSAMESSATSQLHQLQQQHQQQTQHTSPVTGPMTRGPLLSPPSSSSPMSASTFSPGSTLSPLALGGVSSPYSTTSSHVSSPPHHAQLPSMSFPSVPMSQGFPSHTATLMQQQHHMLQPQHNQTQLNHNQHQQHVPPPAYDEAINFNHPPLDVNSYFSNFQQSYGTYDHHQDHLDHHYLTPSPDSPDHGGLIYSPDPPPRVTDWNDQNSNERHDLHSKPTASQQSVFI